MAKSIMQSRVILPSFFSRLRSMWHTLPAADPITTLMVERIGMVQRGEYEPLGIILQMQTPAGWISFPTGCGPALGRFADGIDLLDAWEWNGLPDRYENTDELCPDCQAPCVECFPGDATLKDWQGPESREHDTVAEYVWRDKLSPGERPCIYGNQLEACGGTGRISTQDNKECPSCRGTGKVKCRRCAGTSMMSTGRTPSGKACATCGGSARVRKVIPQILSEYVDAQSSAMVIYKLYLSGPDKATQIWVGKPDGDGDYPHIVSQSHFSCGSRAVILGGVLRRADDRVYPSPRRSR